MNGGGNETLAFDQEFGECLPTADMCVESTSPLSYYPTMMYYGKCNYFGVYYYASLTLVDNVMQHMHITELMGYKAATTPYALFDMLLAPQAY